MGRPRLSKRGGTARRPPASAINRPMVIAAGQHSPRRQQNRSRSGWIFRLPRFGCSVRRRRVSSGGTAFGHSHLRVRCRCLEIGRSPAAPRSRYAARHR